MGGAHDLASMDGLALTGRGRHVLIPCQVVGDKRLRMGHMGVHCQQERGALLHDAHPCMPVPVEASLVSFGLPKPPLQSHVVLEEWPYVSTDEESCGTAGHHSRHVVVKRGVEAGALLLQARELGLPLRGRTVRTGPRGGDTLDRLPLLTDDVVFCLHLGHAAVDKQNPRSSRRNELPVKRIHGSLLMGHKYLARAA